MKPTSILRKKGRVCLISLSILAILVCGFLATNLWGQSDVTEYNKKLVSDFWTMLPTDVEGAFNKYVGEPYIQHDPEYPDGKEGTINQLKKLFASMPENSSGRIIRAIAENDMVALHVHVKANPEDPGQVGFELYRVEDGKIVEHWAVFQEIPEQSLNSNSIY